MHSGSACTSTHAELNHNQTGADKSKLSHHFSSAVSLAVFPSASLACSGTARSGRRSPKSLPVELAATGPQGQASILRNRLLSTAFGAHADVQGAGLEGLAGDAHRHIEAPVGVVRCSSCCRNPVVPMFSNQMAHRFLLMPAAPKNDFGIEGSLDGSCRARHSQLQLGHGKLWALGPLTIQRCCWCFGPYIYIYIYIYIYVHTYIHTYIHTDICIMCL